MIAEWTPTMFHQLAPPPPSLLLLLALAAPQGGPATSKNLGRTILACELMSALGAAPGEKFPDR